MNPNDRVEIRGRCTCGSVRYVILIKPMFVHCCHCSWCQRESGAAFAINALVESNQVKHLSGEIEKIATPTNSGMGQDIFRCDSCKVAVWSNYSAAGDTVKFVRTGTLDNPNECPPDIHIFTSTKQNWLSIDGETPVVPEYYQRSKYWSEGSIKRYKSAIGK